MRKRDKEKYIKLALQSSEKGVPEGHYYVGKGKEGGLPFTQKSMMAKRPSCQTHWGVSGSNGIYDGCEYATAIDDWEAVVGQKLEPAKEAEPKFYYNSDKNNRFFAKYGERAMVVSLVGENSRYHCLFADVDGETDTKLIKNGTWVEVNPADWPENITNSFLIKHIKQNKTTMSRPDIKKVAVKPASQTEFDQLWAIFQLGGLDVSHMTSYGYRKDLDQYWGYLNSNPQGWIGEHFKERGYTLYNSVTDYLNNKPAPAEIKVRLNSQYEAILKDGKVHCGCQSFTVEKIKELAAAIGKEKITLDNSAIKGATDKERKRVWTFFKIAGKDVFPFDDYLDKDINNYFGLSVGKIRCGQKDHFDKIHCFANLSAFLDAVQENTVELNSSCTAKLEEKEVIVTHSGAKIVIPNSAILELAAKLS